MFNSWVLSWSVLFVWLNWRHCFGLSLLLSVHGSKLWWDSSSCFVQVFLDLLSCFNNGFTILTRPKAIIRIDLLDFPGIPFWSITTKLLQLRGALLGKLVIFLNKNVTKLNRIFSTYSRWDRTCSQAELKRASSRIYVGLFPCLFPNFFLQLIIHGSFHTRLRRRTLFVPALRLKSVAPLQWVIRILLAIVLILIFFFNTKWILRWGH